MNRRPITALSIVALIISAPTWADLPTDRTGIVRPLDSSSTLANDTSGWIGTGQGGLLIASGNTNSTAINGKLDLSRKDGPWKQGLFVTGLYGRSQGYVSSERAELRYQIDHAISERNYWFTGVDAVRDLFSGFSYRVTGSGGLGHHFIDTPTTRLSANVGVGYEVFQEQQLLHDSANNVIGRLNGDRIGGIAGTFGLKGERKLSPTTTVREVLAITSAGGDTTMANDLALQVALGGRLALSVGYGLRANSQPPAGAKKLDQNTTVNVVYTLR